MPSFDVVSEVDLQEVRNSVDQANREISNRFDFKGSGARLELVDSNVVLHAPNEFQLDQMLDVLRMRLAKRGVDVGCLAPGAPQVTVSAARQEVMIRQGIDAELARSLVKQIKTAKLKAQTAVQGDQVRVTAKKRDDLQRIIAMLRELDVGLPLQFTNFRD